MKKYKYLALAAAVVLSIGGVIGGSLAWLSDDSEPVTNRFKPAKVDIILSETDNGLDKDGNVNTNDYKMIPGWVLDKDPMVTVKNDSEDCWLFVKITESTAPDLDSYIAYKIAGLGTTESNDCWVEIDDGDNKEESVVIARKVYATADTKTFNILGVGSYIFKNDTPEDESDDVTVSWKANQVGVKPEVTETMMEAITGEGKAQPTLTFDAYAVQLYKTNNVEFTALEAWNNNRRSRTTL